MDKNSAKFPSKGIFLTPTLSSQNHHEVGGMVTGILFFFFFLSHIEYKPVTCIFILVLFAHFKRGSTQWYKEENN